MRSHSYQPPPLDGRITREQRRKDLLEARKANKAETEPNKAETKRGGRGWASRIMGAWPFIPGMLLGVLLGVFLERMPKKGRRLGGKRLPPGTQRPLPNLRASSSSSSSSSSADAGELKMVLVVRHDLKMGSGKIAAQCAHAAVGMCAELQSHDRSLLRKWEACGQPKIVVTCKNLKEMNDLKARAEAAGLPTFVVADAGRTQVAAGSKTVLAVGPGVKAHVDAVTRHLRLLT